LGAGPRASRIIVAAKAHAAFNGKFSPDIEDAAVATEFYVTELLKTIKRMPRELLRK
jgi:MoxR-like ATPase